ncbi:hypothetical protein [Nannocystis pusilla]|uniref:hypothetical protein n=1 Tax=Nannocystis pusilla TaxID=889268 RepID=UPI003B7CDB95
MDERQEVEHLELLAGEAERGDPVGQREGVVLAVVAELAGRLVELLAELLAELSLALLEVRVFVVAGRDGHAPGTLPGPAACQLDPAGPAGARASARLSRPEQRR